MMIRIFLPLALMVLLSASSHSKVSFSRHEKAHLAGQGGILRKNDMIVKKSSINSLNAKLEERAKKIRGVRGALGI